MATREQMTTALLTEHLRYTPLTLLDDIINTVNELVYQAVNNIETALLNVPPDQLGFTVVDKTGQEVEEALEAAARTEIESGIVKLESLLNATVDKDFDKLEIYTLRNLLTVSNAKKDQGLEDWIMLDHYKNLHIDPLHTTNTDLLTPESLDLLYRKAIETEKLQTALRAEKARNDAILAQLRPLLSSSSSQPQQVKSELPSEPQQSESTSSPSLAFLADTAAALGMSTSSTVSQYSPLAQHTRYTFSQLSALREIVQSLRPYLENLASVETAPITIPKSEEERHAYIETQSRRALERVGIEPQSILGAQEDLGRKMGPDEVAALESVVASLTASTTDQKVDEDKMDE